MADISKITLPSGTTYNLKDAEARAAIANLNSFEYIVCTEAANTPENVTWAKGSITITGTLVASASTKSKIYLVPSTNGTRDIYDEYITVNSSGSTYVWEMFGNTDVHMSDLGDLAYKDNASGSYTPAGTVSAPTFTGTELTSTGKVTPSGTVSKPTFSGTEGNVSVSGTPNGNISVGSGTANYTPNGTVSTPTITVTLNTASKYVAGSATGGGSSTAGTAAQCTLPTLNPTVTNETLDLGWSDGSFTPNTPTAVTMPTFTSQTIGTSIKSATSTQPSFTGTGVELKFTGATSTSTGKFTPAGNVSQPNFTGDEADISVKGTPAGNVSQPTFTGTAKTVTVS